MHPPAQVMRTQISSHAKSDANKQLIDQFGRVKQKLRISVTDRCQFHCQYCLADQPIWYEKRQLLSYAQLFYFCQVMVGLGIQQIRITGGEPLLRPGLVNFIQQLNTLKTQGLQRLSLNSNASRLTQLAAPLKHAGLDDVNINLDSIDAVCFQKMTGQDIRPVLAGIFSAVKAGLNVKLNCVLMHGYNQHQMLPLTRWAIAQKIPLRFIEYLPMDFSQQWRRELVVTEAEILSQLSASFEVKALPKQSGTANHYLLDDHYRLGIIATVTQPFCQTCNRLRLSATGEFYDCMFAPNGLDLKPFLHENVRFNSSIRHPLAAKAMEQKQLLQQRILDAVWHKPAGYIAQPQLAKNRISMHAIGG